MRELFLPQSMQTHTNTHEDAQKYKSQKKKDSVLPIPVPLWPILSQN